MKDLDYGKGYRYAHDESDAVADMDCLPENLQGRKFYEPTERGFEKEIKRRLDGWAEIKRRRRERFLRLEGISPTQQTTDYTDRADRLAIRADSRPCFRLHESS